MSVDGLGMALEWRGAEMNSSKSVLIGIDPGKNTGFAVIGESLNYCKSGLIHEIMQEVLQNCRYKPFIYVEDARQRKWYGKGSQAKIQGAGSIKRDCTIWEDFLKDLLQQSKIAGYEMVHPQKGGTKLKAGYFSKLTGIEGRTNEHARDAYMLIFGRKHKNN